LSVVKYLINAGFAWLVVVVCCCASMQAQAAGRSESGIAFYYADAIPVDELGMFGRVVVEPSHLQPSGMERLKQAGSLVFAYVSMGEAARTRPWFSDVSEAWHIGDNRSWNSIIMDLGNEQWQTFIIQRLVAPIVKMGYDGIFLDTLDSYHMIITDKAGILRQQQGLIRLIARLHKQFPTLKLLLNRGFDVVPSVYGQIDGVVAESLFQTWNPATKAYGPVKEDDHQWLLKQLTQLRQSYHLPVYVIDYVAPSDRELARSTSEKISALGFTPWITNTAIDMLGIGNVEVMPRRIMALYDSQESALPSSQVHRNLASPLEYLGYVVDYIDVRQPLPAYTLSGRYAGIVGWFGDNRINAPKRFSRWLIKQMDDGLRVALFQSIGMIPDNALLKRLGLRSVRGMIKRPVRITHADDLAHMEVHPKPLSRGLFPLRAISSDVHVHESITDARGEKIDVVMTAPWGGMALAPYVVETSLDWHVRWRLDIFKFLKQALKLPPMPVFDVTTENGSRLLMTHIDGDGVASRAVMPGAPLSIKVIYDEILRKYRVPATVSVITSELETDGLFPHRAKAMQQVARAIFALPYVEIASHTYSHPFAWGRAAFDEHAHLKIPGYHYNLQQEIAGSVDYINKHLAPANKRVKVFLWSGDALPDEHALALAASLGLKNMNGGATVMTRGHPSLTDVSSMMRPVGGQLQVYAPVMNENLYTNKWTKPLYGFDRAIETFIMTDKPRRLKPIDIYYHFYSGSELASLASLHRVYDWSLKQEVLHLYVSEYTDKVDAFAHAVIARAADDTWYLKTRQALKTVRIPQQMGWPDLQHSTGVAGWRDLPQGRYIHLTGGGVSKGAYKLQFQSTRSRSPYLVKANAMIRSWQLDGRRIRMRLTGYMPIRFIINRRCDLHMNGKTITPDRHDGGSRFALSVRDTGDALLNCR